MAIPDRIYHYTSRAVALEHILPTRRIRMNSLGLTNDPRETKDWGFLFAPIPVSAESSLDIGLLNQIAKTGNVIRRQEWWVLCATLDDPDLVVPAPNQVDLTHFKYGHARGRMWAQYGENHKGVCLVLDGRALHEAILGAALTDSVSFGTVNYTDEWDLKALKERVSALQLDFVRLRDGGMLSSLRDHILRNFKYYFLEKDRDWDREREFRWLINGRSGPYFVDISAALKSVVVGVDFPEVYGPILWHLCDQLGVKVEKMSWNNRVPSKSSWQASK